MKTIQAYEFFDLEKDIQNMVVQKEINKLINMELYVLGEILNGDMTRKKEYYTQHEQDLKRRARLHIYEFLYNANGRIIGENI